MLAINSKSVPVGGQCSAKMSACDGCCREPSVAARSVESRRQRNRRLSAWRRRQLPVSMSSSRPLRTAQTTNSCFVAKMSACDGCCREPSVAARSVESRRQRNRRLSAWRRRQLPVSMSSSRPLRTAQTTNSCFVWILSLSWIP